MVIGCGNPGGYPKKNSKTGMSEILFLVNWASNLFCSFGSCAGLGKTYNPEATQEISSETWWGGAGFSSSPCSCCSSWLKIDVNKTLLLTLVAYCPRVSCVPTQALTILHYLTRIQCSYCQFVQSAQLGGRCIKL